MIATQRRPHFDTKRYVRGFSGLKLLNHSSQPLAGCGTIKVLVPIIELPMSTTFVSDSDGNTVAVVLDIATYRALVEAAEDAEDTAWARDYTARKAAGTLTDDERETVPLDDVVAELQARRAAENEPAA
jgi:hypothetical protein